MADTEATGNVVKNTEFKSAGDWINQILAKHCIDANVGAVEAVAEVKDKDGNVTTEGVRGKKGKDVVNLENLTSLAEENHLTVKEYVNAGMARMNVGNMLRAAARKRGGLFIKGRWTKAPEDFEVLEPLTHGRDGEKLAVKKVDEKAA